MPSTVRSKIEPHGLAHQNQIWTAKGCEVCDWEGYKGRIALADLQTNAAQDETQSLEKAALELLTSGETALQDIGGLLS